MISPRSLLIAGVLLLAVACRTSSATEDSREAAPPGAGPGVAASEKRARKHVDFLASDALRGRETGSAGYERAGAYVERELEGYGLQPLFGDSYRQPFSIRQVTVDRQGWVEFRRSGNTRRVPLLGGATVMRPLVGRQSERELRLVFVGLGIHEPEAGWDEYQALDLSETVDVLDREMAAGGKM